MTPRAGIIGVPVSDGTEFKGGQGQGYAAVSGRPHDMSACG